MADELTDKPGDPRDEGEYHGVVAGFDVGGRVGVGAVDDDEFVDGDVQRFVLGGGQNGGVGVRGGHDAGEALPLLEQALGHAQTLWNTEIQRALLVRTLDCATSLGKLDLAKSTYRRALEVTDAANNAHGVGWLLIHHSRLRRAYGNVPAAMAEAREGLRLMVEAGDPRGVFIANLRLAEALPAGGDSPGAATLLHTLLSTSDAASVPLLKAKADALLAQATPS
ncbi:hypothetical protein [Micromonospora sp. CPCC 206061]|uniref:hypothetical protein n=1 Tax=Micromonospora sp. CPCC 206061 TaxID=3122410 RepID=UPI002FEFFEF4